MKLLISIIALLTLCAAMFALQPLRVSEARSGAQQIPGPTPPLPKPLPDITPVRLYFDRSCDLVADIKNQGAAKINRYVHFQLYMDGVENTSSGVSLFLMPGSTTTKRIVSAALSGVWAREKKEWRFGIG